MQMAEITDQLSICSTSSFFKEWDRIISDMTQTRLADNILREDIRVQVADILQNQFDWMLDNRQCNSAKVIASHLITNVVIDKKRPWLHCYDQDDVLVETIKERSRRFLKHIRKHKLNVVVTKISFTPTAPLSYINIDLDIQSCSK